MPLGDIISLDFHIKETFPNTHKSLCDKFGDQKHSTYARVYQFLACNFSTKDGTPDIDEDGNFYLEKVSCPTRHTCKMCFCNPEIVSLITHREREIIEFFVKGFDLNEIAERLFISPNTVHNHQNNIYAKFGLVGKTHPDRLLMSMYYEKKI
jgi:DNA-binding CsgD family transcriptional regulator